MKKNKSKNYKEQFLCFCSRVSYEKFHKELISYQNHNLEKICTKLELAKHCAACLPNIEDEYFQLIGRKRIVNNIIFKGKNPSLGERFKTLVDKLGGNKLINQYGHLPMLASKSIKTWLVISNEEPSIIRDKIIHYRLNLTFYNKRGNKLKTIVRPIDPKKAYKFCLNDYIEVSDNQLRPYYIKVKRQPLSRGFRGSTRPHFFYETKNSMATLHIQDGSSKKSFINLYLSNNKDKNFIFIINPGKNKAIIEPNTKIFYRDKMKKQKKQSAFIVPPNGSNLLELNQLESKFENHIVECKSSEPIKCYFIISDNNLDRISVDHM